MASSRPNSIFIFLANYYEASETQRDIILRYLTLKQCRYWRSVSKNILENTSITLSGAQVRYLKKHSTIIEEIAYGTQNLEELCKFLGKNKSLLKYMISIVLPYLSEGLTWQNSKNII
jgi:hypothetical protein